LVEMGLSKMQRWSLPKFFLRGKTRPSKQRYLMTYLAHKRNHHFCCPPIISKATHFPRKDTMHKFSLKLKEQLFHIKTSLLSLCFLIRFQKLEVVFTVTVTMIHFDPILSVLFKQNSVVISSLRQFPVFSFKVFFDRTMLNLFISKCQNDLVIAMFSKRIPYFCTCAAIIFE
jgi:hypothetical protein